MWKNKDLVCSVITLKLKGRKVLLSVTFVINDQACLNYNCELCMCVCLCLNN